MTRCIECLKRVPQNSIGIDICPGCLLNTHLLTGEPLSSDEVDYLADNNVGYCDFVHVGGGLWQYDPLP